MTAKLKVVTDFLAAQLVQYPGQKTQTVTVHVNYDDATDGMWHMEMDAVPKALTVLTGPLSDNSKRILTELSKTKIVTHWCVLEEEDGSSALRLELYGQVQHDIPMHEANASVKMLEFLLHAQAHVELGD